MCLIFYDLDVQKRTFYGCTKVEVYLIDIDVLHLDLGCFHMGPHEMFSDVWLQDITKGSIMKQISIQ